MKKPDFLVIGTAKGGTSTLCTYLALHPDIFLPKKESHFFEEEYEKGLEFYWNTYFADWNGEKIIGEKRPGNLWNPVVPARIKEFVPTAKLIAILRNPVERAHSEWWMYTVQEKETRSFEEAINQGDYLDMGRYAEQIERYFALFDRSQIKVLFLEDMKKNTEEVIRDVWSFVGVRNDIEFKEIAPENIAVQPSTVGIIKLARKTGAVKVLSLKVKRFGERLLAKPGARPVMEPKVRKYLLQYYKPHNERLSKLLQRDLSHWNR